MSAEMGETTAWGTEPPSGVGPCRNGKDRGFPRGCLWPFTSISEAHGLTPCWGWWDSAVPLFGVLALDPSPSISSWLVSWNVLSLGLYLGSAAKNPISHGQPSWDLAPAGSLRRVRGARALKPCPQHLPPAFKPLKPTSLPLKPEWAVTGHQPQAGSQGCVACIVRNARGGRVGPGGISARPPLRSPTCTAAPGRVGKLTFKDMV